jgi:photosystem II stability/assembly factor-like uncharacterized protein
MAKTPQDEYQTSVITVTGDDLRKLHLLANVSPRVGDPEEIVSVVADFSVDDELTAVPIHQMDSWLTYMEEPKQGVLHAVSMDGELHSYRGGNWSVLDLDCPKGISRVWASSEDEVFATGRAGEKIRVARGTPEIDRDKKGRCLNNVHGTSRNHVVIVGEKGAIFRFDGRKWTDVVSPTNYNLLAVLCRSKKEVYVGGAKGKAFRSDGEDWEPIACPPVMLYSFAWFRDKLWAAAGKDGILVLGDDGFESAKKLNVFRIKTVADRLFAIGGNEVTLFDGKQWLGADVDF